MKYLLLVSTLFLAACAQPNNQNPPQAVTQDETLLSIAQNVYENLHELGSNPRPLSTISFAIESNSNTTQLAVCYRWANGDAKIAFKPETLMNYTRHEVEGIMLHELGHCALNLEHDDRMIAAPNDPGYSMPATIMNTYFYKYWWNNYTDYYYQEMAGH